MTDAEFQRLAQIALVVGAAMFTLLGIVLPISAYAAQKWAYRCHQQIEKTNNLLAQILQELSKKPQASSESGAP